MENVFRCYECQRLRPIAEYRFKEIGQGQDKETVQVSTVCADCEADQHVNEELDQEWVQKFVKELIEA